MKKKGLLVLLLIIAVAVTGCSFNQKEEKKNTNRKLEKVFDYVMDAGTYKSIDFDYSTKWFKKQQDNWGGGCTAVGKVLDDGTPIVGRNMDLTYSNKAAYIFRTDLKGKYKTVNLAYTHRDYAPEYKDVIKNGISEEFDKNLPFFSDDVLNEKGLYVEINMRNAETWYDGSDKFSSDGTNKDSKERVFIFQLPMYIGLNCASVDEVVPYLETLNIYSKKGYWNYAFLVADSTGKMGVVEIANNKIYFNENVHSQANYYVTPELAKINEYKTGTGRIDYVNAHINNIKTTDDMFKMMNDIHYSQTYDYKNSKFDVMSEMVDVYPQWTYSYVMDPANKAEIEGYLSEISSQFQAATLEQIKRMNVAWQSVFTEVVNLKDKTIKVRFYEDDNLIYDLGFDK